MSAGFLASFPGLTPQMMKKHLPNSLATAKGHQKQTKQGIRSTNTNHKPTTLHTAPQYATSPPPQPNPGTTPTDNSAQHAIDMTAAPQLTTGATRTNCAFLTTTEIGGKIATDLCGRFPVTALTGNKYIMVLYCEDADGILAHPLRNRSEQELLKAKKSMHNRLKSCGIHLIYQIMDNECLQALKLYLQK